MRTKLWHLAYCRWYDHRAAGQPRRAALWGRISDTLRVMLWPMARNNNGARRFTRIFGR